MFSTDGSNVPVREGLINRQSTESVATERGTGHIETWRNLSHFFLSRLPIDC